MTKKSRALFMVDGVQVSLRNLRRHSTSADEFRRTCVARVEAQSTLHITLHTLQDWSRPGKLRAVRQSGQWHYNRYDLVALLA